VVVEKHGIEKERTICETLKTSIFEVVLARILRTAVRAGRGGAFVILPDGITDPASSGIKLLHSTTGLDLFADAVQHFDACIQEYACRGQTSHQMTLDIWYRQQLQMLINAEMIGNFSLIDGAVVLSRRLTLYGFGAKIQVSVAQAEKSNRHFKDTENGKTYDDESFMRSIGGTRHQSAARLCQAFPETLVFTVSQDGDLKLFYSDQGAAYLHGPLDLPTLERESIL
jgi:hypothetical protein